LILIGVGLLALSAIIGALFALLQNPATWIAVLIALAVAGLIQGREYYYKNIYPNRYFASEDFLELKEKLRGHAEDCNNLNIHIAELKGIQGSFSSTNKGSGALQDTSQYSYSRREWQEASSGRHVHDCSRTVVSNAKNNPFKYLCKYFGIKPTEDSLNQFEEMLNDFSAAEEGIQLLLAEREDLLQGILQDIPDRILKYHIDRFWIELGFDPVDFEEFEFPTYTFQYVSSGGYSSVEFNIEFNIDTIQEFVEYLANLVKFRKSIAGQRALMTPSLRNKIKERDDFTCQQCSLSIDDEKNLLLEIDHIVPLAKGGITSEDNLQTLCWRCNRSKGSKLLT